MPPRDEPLLFTYFDSPVGRLLLAGDGESLHLVSFPSGSKAQAAQAHWRRDDTAFAEPSAQFTAYFAGELTRFDLALHLAGTEFQNRVWTTLAQIPFGTTTTYSELAGRVGRPRAVRAVGTANGANPLPIILPCHRVIGRDSTLRGFGGGLDTKRFLLDHERRVAARE